jgi:hypothetical protein
MSVERMNRFLPILTVDVLTLEYDSWVKYGDRHSLRFGQYMVNKYLKENTGFSCPEIFYEKDEHKARSLIFDDITTVEEN